MHYYIDGYNIIFRVLHVSESLQLQREALIYDLSYKADLFDLDLTVVFDSHYQEGDRDLSHFDRLKIVYTSKGESADDYIIKAVKHSVTPKQEVVITSDNHLAWKIRSLGGKAEPAEEFMERLQRRFKNHIEGIEESEEAEEFSEPEAVISPQQVTIVSSVELPTLIQPSQKKCKKTGGDSCQPAKASLPEECFEYYQRAFEQEYESLKNEEFPTLIVSAASEEVPSSKPASKKAKPDKTGSIEDKLSDSDRWLKAFERDQEEKNSDNEGFELL